jgi:hypothetical protein
VGYLQNFMGAGNFTYSRFPMPLFTTALFFLGFYSQSDTTSVPYGGYANNFSYSSIDNISFNARVAYCGTSGSYQTEVTISMPYGLTGLGGVNSAAYMGAVETGCPIISPYANYFADFLKGPNYRLPASGHVCCITNAGTGSDAYFYTDAGHWHKTQGLNNPTFLGRLWDGLVFTSVFTHYSGCVYTEDMITFYPLLDITGQIDFTNNSNFGLQPDALGTVFFMSGFGYSYLANYLQGTTPFTQAAYKIYPAFNFNPLIPDKQFVPNICGCNNTPILKNGVIQHG